jgi:CubicO group peptidase (beta-lactamase class C family)
LVPSPQGTEVAAPRAEPTRVDAVAPVLPWVLSTGLPAARFPAPDWPTGDPQDHGLDPAALEWAGQVAQSEESYCLLVIRHGVLVFESYAHGATAQSAHPSWSIAKSYTATLFGIAVARGDLPGLEVSVADFVPEWRGGPRAAVTVRQLLSMTSGLHWGLFEDYVTLAMLSQNNTQDAVGRPLQDAPGSKWTYNNGAVQVLERVLKNATGQTLEEYAQAHLWSRLGMSADWKQDPAGNPTAYANVLATCRDHARLGYLYLRRGRWAGEQVLPERWVAEALAPSQPHNRAYGFLFWLNGHTPAQNAMGNAWAGKMAPYAPDDLFAARGFGNQFIDVIPSLDLVVVRFGKDPTNGGVNLQALVDDSEFGRHEKILAPVLLAIDR